MVCTTGIHSLAAPLPPSAQRGLRSVLALTLRARNPWLARWVYTGEAAEGVRAECFSLFLRPLPCLLPGRAALPSSPRRGPRFARTHGGCARRRWRDFPMLHGVVFRRRSLPHSERPTAPPLRGDHPAHNTPRHEHPLARGPGPTGPARSGLSRRRKLPLYGFPRSSAGARWDLTRMPRLLPCTVAREVQPGVAAKTPAP
jgi:hypothetical protein